jgi:hypothetical protein
VLHRANLLTGEILGDADFGRLFHGGKLVHARRPGKPKPPP